MKKVSIIVVALLCTIAIAGYKLYNKSHRAVEEEEAIVLTAVDLFAAYETNEEDANKKYLDKVIEVKGMVSEILLNQDGKTVIILSTSNPMFGINCTLENTSDNIQTGSTLFIKGICTGYLSDVVITHGIIEKK